MKKSVTALSRKWLDEQTWAGLLSGHDPGKLSVKEYCARQGVSAASYYRWQKRLGGEKEGELFNPIEIGAGRIEASVELELPGGIVLRFGALPPVDYLRSLSVSFSGVKK
ncbi:MAG TPA: hypothetical protein PKL15_07835 [Saprospiraceae bacterium]|nr:hypothetical protein [Ferruginibacter sp.]HNM25324.1 hypothetical protein [Saprospiraceae bacterium]